MKQKSLGSAIAAVRGIVASALATGTPLHVTLTAGHRLRNGERIAIAGAAADSGLFGEWSVSEIAAASATLDGSTGTAALSGTPVIAALCDKTPFLPRNSGVVIVGPTLGVTATAAVGTAVIEKADGQSAGGFTYTNSSGTATAGFADALLSGEIAIPASALGSGGLCVEVMLARYMTFRLSAWTSGSFGASILA